MKRNKTKKKSTTNWVNKRKYYYYYIATSLQGPLVKTVFHTCTFGFKILYKHKDQVYHIWNRITVNGKPGNSVDMAGFCGRYSIGISIF